MKKVLIIISFAIVIVGAVFYGIGIHHKETRERQTLQENLITAIEYERSSNERIIIDFKHITNFSWDKVYIFTPYTSREQINKKLGFTWSKADLIELSDSFNLIVFVKGKKVVQYVEFSREYGDFIIDNKNEYTSNETVEIKPIN